MRDYNKFKELLDQEYSWPSPYLFKFVVLAEHSDEVLKAIAIGELVSKKSSRNGKYISLSIQVVVYSSDEIIEIYKKASLVEGVISL